MHARRCGAHTRCMDLDGLVELPTYRPAPVYDATHRKPVVPKGKRVTLLDRLVSTAGVDEVSIDLPALEADIDRLRAD